MEKETNQEINPKTKKINKLAFLLVGIIFFIIILDQISKFAMLKQETREIIPNFVKFEITENKNGTYGVEANSTFSYVLTNLIVIIIISKFMTSQNQFVDKKTKILLSLIIGGGMSNVLDRLIRGYVIEFIHIKGLPIFNVADIFILVGWISMVAIITGFTAKEIQRNKAKKQIKKEKKDEV